MRVTKRWNSTQRVPTRGSRAATSSCSGQIIVARKYPYATNGWLYWGTLGSQRHTAIPDKDSHCGRARYPYCCTRAQCARYPDTGVRPPRTAILRERRHNTAIPPTYKCRSMAKYAYFNTTDFAACTRILQITADTDCRYTGGCRLRYTTAGAAPHSLGGTAAKS